MEYRANSHDFAVVVDSLYAANRFSEQPRTHRVIEQIRFGESLRMLNHGRDKRTIGYADACNQSSLRRVPIDERLRWCNRLLLVADRFSIDSTSRQPASIVSEWPRRRSSSSGDSQPLRFMEISEAQYQRIASSLPRQRGNVKLNNLQLLNALLYVAEHGCKWRGLPKRFGHWHTIYTRMNRWSKSGVLDQVFEQLQREQIVRIRIESVSLDSHHRQSPSRRHRRVKKNGPQAIGKSRSGWTTKIHMVAADARTAITFALSPGQASDTIEGRKLLGGIGPLPAPLHLVMDRAYEDNETLQLALDFGLRQPAPCVMAISQHLSARHHFTITFQGPTTRASLKDDLG